MTPLYVGTNSYTHDFRFYSKENVSPTHQIAWEWTLKPQIAWAARGLPPLKFPQYSLFWQKGSQKTINYFSHFHGLMPDNNYKHFECFVMIGTHSKPSHSCHIFWPPFTFSTPNLAPFPTWSYYCLPTCSIGTRKSNKRLHLWINLKCSVLPLLTATGAN